MEGNVEMQDMHPSFAGAKAVALRMQIGRANQGHYAADLESCIAPQAIVLRDGFGEIWMVMASRLVPNSREGMRQVDKRSEIQVGSSTRTVRYRVGRLGLQGQGQGCKARVRRLALDG